MDELQDAIQDAQYIGVMTDPSPHPTVAFRFPKPETLELWKKQDYSDYLDFLDILSQPIGMYLFRKICRDQQERFQLDFLEEIYIYRKTSQGSRPELARQIWWLYCTSNATGPASGGAESPGNFFCIQRHTISSSSLIERYKPCFCDTTLLGIQGHPIDNVGQYLTEYQQHSETLSTLPQNLFHEVEMAVLAKLAYTAFPLFLESKRFNEYLAYQYLQKIPVTEQDFENYRVLGRGGFGMVNASIKKNTGKLYAMKMMNKKIIKSKNAESLCLNERNMLSKLNSRFIVSLNYAFQTKDDLILIMDLITGGDLGYHLSKERFPEEKAAFYGAQIFLALLHMHQHNIIYRDLKPDNIILDEAGNCKLSDLGLAVEMSPDLCGRCGTRGYWAPEMLSRNADGSRINYNQSIDYWSFGCVLYEFLYGRCPFRTIKAKSFHSDKQISMDIATLEMEIEYDSKIFSPEAESILRGLLVRDPTQRLGVQNPDEIKNHPFFSSIDWVMLENGAVQPPFVPTKNINAASQSDIGAFDMTGVKKLKLTHEEESLYRDWYYSNPIKYQEEIIEFLQWEDQQGPSAPQIHSKLCCSIL